MAKYEFRQTRGGYDLEWRTRAEAPVRSIVALLDEYPDAVVTMGAGAQWRRKARDEELLDDITGIVQASVLGETTIRKAGVEIYDLLEEKGLL